MRRLAQRLGVEAMSLYHYARARTSSSMPHPRPRPPGDRGSRPTTPAWKAALRHDAIVAHAVLRRHPWAAGRLMSARTVSPPGCGSWSRCSSHLRGAGFDPEQTDHAYHALDSHITGFTLWQVSIAVRGTPTCPAMGATLPARAARGRVSRPRRAHRAPPRGGSAQRGHRVRVRARPDPRRPRAAARTAGRAAAATAAPAPSADDLSASGRAVGPAGLHANGRVLQSPAKGPEALVSAGNAVRRLGRMTSTHGPIGEQFRDDSRPRPRLPSFARRSSGSCRASSGRP